MYNWKSYFDSVYVVTLEDVAGQTTNKSRRALLTTELKAYGIDAHFYFGVRKKDGALGLRLTMKRIFRRSLAMGHSRILVLEDDLTFLTDPNPVMEKCVADLKERDWDLFYLGPNMHERFEYFVTPNLLPVQHGYSTHAVAYNKEAMQLALAAAETISNPMDVILDEYVQSRGKSFCSYPMLATQRNGWSNIEKREVDYFFIQNRFKIFTQHLL